MDAVVCKVLEDGLVIKAMRFNPDSIYTGGLSCLIDAIIADTNNGWQVVDIDTYWKNVATDIWREADEANVVYDGPEGEYIWEDYEGQYDEE